MSMESLYQVVGISRQGFHQHRRRLQWQEQQVDSIIERVKHYRQFHPRMGARPIYQLMSAHKSDQQLIEHLGRDKFESILITNGLGIEPIRIFHITTYSGAFRFPNLTEGLEINDINRVWISDLTYYRLLDGWAYLTFILDLYSRRCLGYALSQTLETEQTTMKALKMALKTRGKHNFDQQLIFHSDGGGQYYDKGFLKLLRQYQIVSSMAECVYENPHVERFHSTAKNQYLIPWGVNSVCQLQKRMPQFIKLYNQMKPHRSLKGKSPLDFEKFIQQIPLCQRPVELFKKIT
ncbi:integrase [Flavilitoribacter nigricans DSM 23189 = NBRC 102662]|uniref:Integrase n=2 Tax=Flavilitoribacter TaxID=2762562 RepID=A0A2D0MYH1_FLAN2|nr:integrase [Flavilitoribacter nigricans DSM 23189 = NBRC 102662]